MDEPLDNKIGNWLEVEESLEFQAALILTLAKVNNVLRFYDLSWGKASSLEEGEKNPQEKLQTALWKNFMKWFLFKAGLKLC